MKVVVCIGSSCYIKGSGKVVTYLQYKIKEDGLGNKVELSGTFCTGQCQKGICVTVDGKLYSVSVDSMEKSYEEEIKAKLK